MSHTLSRLSRAAWSGVAQAPAAAATRGLSCSAALRDAPPSLPQAAHFPAVKSPALPAGTFDGRVVLVSGGGTGLGKGMATRFSELGAKVAIASRRLPVLESTAEEVSSATGNPVLPVQCDVRDPDAVRRAVDECQEKLGQPTVVVNNAAGNFISPTERLSPNAFKTILDIVLAGSANLTLETGKRMIENRTGGVFLAITTHYTNEGSAYVVPSACAKSGVETMMKSLGVEWGKYGIRTACIAPGPIYTEGAFSRLDPTGSMLGEAVKEIPVGRLGEVEEIANLATFLCSDYASWISAETVHLDGGEFRSLAGEFNKLRKIPDEMWDQMAEMIKASNAKQKNKTK